MEQQIYSDDYRINNIIQEILDSGKDLIFRRILSGDEFVHKEFLYVDAPKCGLIVSLQNDECWLIANGLTFQNRQLRWLSTFFRFRKIKWKDQSGTLSKTVQGLFVKHKKKLANEKKERFLSRYSKQGKTWPSNRALISFGFLAGILLASVFPIWLLFISFVVVYIGLSSLRRFYKDFRYGHADKGQEV